jgi:hypothetical protein
MLYDSTGKSACATCFDVFGQTHNYFTSRAFAVMDEQCQQAKNRDLSGLLT